MHDPDMFDMHDIVLKILFKTENRAGKSFLCRHRNRNLLMSWY